MRSSFLRFRVVEICTSHNSGRVGWKFRYWRADWLNSLYGCEMGPFLLTDLMGMMVAASILDRSLDPEKTEEFVQWSTFRGMRSFVTNATQAGVSGLSEVVGAYERNRVWISGSVTHSFWFSRFMDGLHKRVGEMRMQDEPISIGVLHALEIILENKWRLADRPSPNVKYPRWGPGSLPGSVLDCVERKCY